MRLEVDARRAQLLELGRDLFARHRYEDLSIGAIARAAGISKGLLYHYFPSKRRFYVESVREAADELLYRASPPANSSPLERLRAGIDIYLRYAEEHRSVFAAHLWRKMVDREESRLTHGARLHFFDRLFVDTAATPIGRNALRGWVGFVETCVVDWVESPALSREELTELFVNTFQRVVAPAVPTRALSIPG